MLAAVNEKAAGGNQAADSREKIENLDLDCNENLNFPKPVSREDSKQKMEYLIIPKTLTAKNQIEVFLKTEKKNLSLTWRGAKKSLSGEWPKSETPYFSIQESRKVDLLKLLKKVKIPIDEIELREFIPPPEIPKYLKKANRIQEAGNQYNKALQEIEFKEAEELENAKSVFITEDISATEYLQRIGEIKNRYAPQKQHFLDLANRNYEAANVVHEQGEESLKAGNEEPVDQNQIVAAFNQSFAIIEVPQFGIIEFGKDKIWIHKKRDILDRFQNQKVITGYIIMDNGDSKAIHKTKAEIWLSALDRNTYYTIDFRPDQSPGEFIENGKRIYNSWVGLCVKPKKGNCELFKRHMLEIICAGDRVNFDYLWRLVSNWVQRPWERTCSPVFRGAQGIGKGAFTETIGKIFGPTYFLTNEHEQVFGRFNAAIMGKVLLHLDEALVDGGRRFIGKVKGIITGPQFPIEMKGRDPISMNNPRKMMISSNESFAIPVDADDRRFLFLDVAPRRARDIEYFKNLFHEINNGGVEALLYDLLNTDLKGFDPMQLPRGGQKFGFDNKIASAGSFHKFLFQAFSEGTFNLGAMAGKWTTEIRTDLLYDHYLDFCDPRKLSPVMEEAVGRELQKMLGKTGFSKTRRRFDGGPKYVYVVPDLTKCKEAFAEAYKTTSTNIFCED